MSFAFDEDDDDDEDDNDDEDDESAATVTAQVIPLPRIGDTVAVNLLILLEEVSLARSARHSYMYGFPSYSASHDDDMLPSLRGGFGEDLLLAPPLTVTSDAALFVRTEELRVIAENRRRRRRMKKQREKRGGAAAGAGGVFAAVGAAAAGGGGGVEYVPLLDAGAKLMLRLALWDLVERLSV